MVINMPEFLRDLLIASAACAVIGLLSDSLSGGIDKSLSLVCSLVLLFYLVSPLVGMINDYQNDDLTSFLPDVSVGEIQGSIQNNIILDESEKLLMKRETERIKKKYSLNEDDFSLDIKLSSDVEKVDVGEITLTVKTLKALAYEKNIVYELEDSYLCKCQIIEEL